MESLIYAVEPFEPHGKHCADDGSDTEYPELLRKDSVGGHQMITQPGQNTFKIVGLHAVFPVDNAGPYDNKAEYQCFQSQKYAHYMAYAAFVFLVMVIGQAASSLFF